MNRIRTWKAVSVTGETMAAKLWRNHIVWRTPAANDVLYVDLHLLHEVNTPVAFAGLRAAGRTVRRPDLTLGTEDHAVPTVSADHFDPEPARRNQRRLISRNCAATRVPLHRLGSRTQGIVHVIGPEMGLVRPGMTVVCCDSHTTTLGAFGALAVGIGTSQVEHVLATQTLVLARPKDMAVTVTGELPRGSTAKDLALSVIAHVGTGGAQGHLVEFRGDAVRSLSMEGRMTLCNMAVELGGRTGMVAPDATTRAYLREVTPEIESRYDGLAAVGDQDAVFDQEIVVDAATVVPRATWGTNPAQSVPIDGRVPQVADIADPAERAAARHALDYMGLRPGTAMRDIAVDAVFVGSCTNSRIEDLRAVAAVLDGRGVGVPTMIVPGSARVRRQAVAEGLDRVFAEAGADFRASPGCSMCVALGEDRIGPGRRCASTTNRNFEGRQGLRSRTHLVSPAVAAATAVTGRLTAPGDL